MKNNYLIIGAIVCIVAGLGIFAATYQKSEEVFDDITAADSPLEDSEQIIDIEMNGDEDFGGVDLQNTIADDSSAVPVLSGDSAVSAPKEKPLYYINENDPYGRFIADECAVISLCNGPIDCFDRSFVESSAGSLAGNCVALPQFACYPAPSNRCEIQADTGSCGWSSVPELTQCLQGVDDNSQVSVEEFDASDIHIVLSGAGYDVAEKDIRLFENANMIIPQLSQNAWGVAISEEKESPTDSTCRGADYVFVNADTLEIIGEFFLLGMCA